MTLGASSAGTHRRLRVRQCQALLGLLLRALVKVNQVIDLTMFALVRDQSHRKLMRIVQHILHNLLYINVHGLYHVLEVVFLGVQVTQREVETLGCQNIKLLFPLLPSRHLPHYLSY